VNNNQIALNLKLDTTSFERELQGVKKSLSQLDNTVELNAKTSVAKTRTQRVTAPAKQLSAASSKVSSASPLGADVKSVTAALKEGNLLTKQQIAYEQKRQNQLAKLIAGQSNSSSERSFANKEPLGSKVSEGFFNFSSQLLADAARDMRIAAKNKPTLGKMAFGFAKNFVNNLQQGFQFKFANQFAERYIQRYEQRLNMSFNDIADKIIDVNFAASDMLVNGIKKGYQSTKLGEKVAAKKERYNEVKDGVFGNKEKGITGVLPEQVVKNQNVVLEGAVASVTASLVNLSEGIDKTSLVDLGESVDGVVAALEGYAGEIVKGYGRFQKDEAIKNAGKYPSQKNFARNTNRLQKDKVGNLIFNAKDEQGNDQFTKGGLREIYKKASGREAKSGLTREQLIIELDKLKRGDVIRATNKLGSMSRTQGSKINADRKPEKEVIARTAEIKTKSGDIAKAYEEIVGNIKNIEHYSANVGLNEAETYQYLVGQYTMLRAMQGKLEQIKNTTEFLGTEESKALNDTNVKFRNTLQRKGSKDPDGGAAKVSKSQADLARFRPAAGELGHDFDAGYAKGINADNLSPEAAFELGKATVESLRKAQDSASPSKKTKKLGKDFGSGYATGIDQSKLSSKSASKLGKDAIEALRAAQDSNSDSKETNKLGKDFGGGFASGINDKLKDVKKEASKLVDAAKEELKPTSASARYVRTNFPDVASTVKHGKKYYAAGLNENTKEAIKERDLAKARLEYEKGIAAYKEQQLQRAVKLAKYRATKQTVEGDGSSAAFFVAGLIGAKGKGTGSYSQYKEASNVKAQRVDNKTTDIQNITKDVVFRSLLNHFRIGNRDSVELAAKAIAANKKSGGQTQVSGVGHSYGSHVVDVMGKILLKAGIKSRTQGFGQPMGTVSPSTHTGKVGTADVFYWVNKLLGGRGTQSVNTGRTGSKGVGHDFKYYAQDLDKDGKGSRQGSSGDILNRTESIEKFLKAVDIASDEIKEVSYNNADDYNRALKDKIEELRKLSIGDILVMRRDNHRSNDTNRDTARKLGYTEKTFGANDGKVVVKEEKQPKTARQKLRGAVAQRLGLDGGNELALKQQAINKLQSSLIGLKNTLLEAFKAHAVSGLIKALAVGVAGVGYAAYQAAKGVIQLADTLGESINNAVGFELVKKSMDSLQTRAAKLTIGVAALGLAFVGVQLLKPFAKFIRGAIEARSQVDSLYASMRAAGSNVSRNDFLDNQIAKANKAYSSVESYSKLEASLKSTVGKQGGDASGLTAKLSSGLAKRGVGGEEAARFLAGVSQMASKGVVSMEELRQQMSEALPASMSIAAESMGLTTAQFNELVASGSLLSSDFLPKFAVQLDTVSGGLKTAKMSGAEFGNEMLALKDSVGRLIPVNTILAAMTKGVQLLKIAAVPLVAILGGLLVGTLVTAAAGIYLIVGASTLATAALGLLATTAIWAGGAFIAIIAGMKLYSEIVGSSEKKIGRVRKELQGQIADQEKLNKAQAVKPKNFFGRVKEGYDQRKANMANDEIQLNTQAIFDQMQANKAPSGSLLSDEQIKATSAKIQDLKAQAANGLALKLSPAEVIVLGTQAEEMQTKLSKQIDLKYNISNQKATLVAAEGNLAAIQEQINTQGLTATLKISRDETVRQIEEIKAELKRIATLELSVNLTAQNKLAAEAGREGLSFAIADTKINTEMSALKDAVQQNTTQAGIDAALKKATLTAMKQELALNTKQIAKEQKVVSGATKTQRDIISAQSGGKQLEQLDFTSLINVQKQLEAIAASSGTDVDANIVAIIEAQKQTLQVTQQNKQLSVDITKAELEMRNTIRELEISIKGLAIEVKSKVLELARYGLTASRFKEDKVRPLALSASDNKYSFEGIVRSQTEAYAGAVRGIKDFNYGITQATQDLRAKILSVKFDTAKSAIGGISTRLAAQGVDDKYGIGKLRELAVKGLDVSQGSQSATLEREREEIKRTFKEELRSQEANRKALKLDSESQIRDLRKQKEENNFNKVRSAQDIPLEVTELQNQRDSLVLSVEALQKTITETNEQAKVYGLSNRAESFRATVPNIDVADLEGTKASMDALYSQIDAGLANTISTLQGIAASGDANISAELSKAKALQDERLAAKAEEIALDKERQETANKDLVREISATQVGIIADLGTQATQTRGEILSVKEAINELLGTAGLQGNVDDFASQAVAQQAEKVQAKIDEFKSVSAKLKSFADANQYTEAGLAGIMGIVGDNSKLIDPKVLGALTVAADNIRESGNYGEVEALLKDLISAYEKGAGVLTANKDTIANAAGSKVRRDAERGLQDIGFDNAQAQIDGSDRFTANKKAKLSANLQKVRDDDAAARQFNDAKTSGVPLDVARKTYDAMLKLSQLKFDNTMKGLSTLREYIELLRAPLESMLFNVGEKIGKGLGGALDTDEYNNKLNEVNAQFGQDLLQIQEQYAEDPAGLAAATERLKELNEAKLDNVSKEFSTLANVLGAVKDAVLEVAGSIAKLLIQKGVEKVLGGILGGASGGTGGIGQSIGNGLAGLFGGGKYAGGTVGAYANGGMVGSYLKGGAVADTFKNVMDVEERRSGKKAIPIVAHEGEEVLSTLNKDAQYFRMLQSTGQWDAMKEGKSNFYSGGTVGKASSASYNPAPRQAQGNSGGSGTTIHTNFNIQTKNVNEFYRSQDQVAASTKQRLEEASRRRG
jgi:tape measure domain-containing protein